MAGRDAGRLKSEPAAGALSVRLKGFVEAAGGLETRALGAAAFGVEAVAEFAAGKVEYRTDKGGNIHAVIGKMSFPEDDLVANYNHFAETIERARPSSVKGDYVKKITVSGTMTPGVQVAFDNGASE